MQAGTLDAMDAEGREGGGLDVVRPEHEYWTRCRTSWLGEVSGLTQFDRFA